MTTQEYREIYGDLTHTNNYVYPNHFFANYDNFTLHIPFWEFLFKELNFKNQKNLNFLEIGTAQGRSAVWLLENILVDDSCKLTSVDITHKTFLEKVKLKVGKKSGEEIYNLEYSNLENLKPYIIKNKFEFYQTTSDNFFNFLKSNVLVENDLYLGIEYKRINSTYKNKIYDFVYIDGSHDPDQVLKDAINAFEFLKTNGFILFDDYSWKNPRTNLICGVGIDSFLYAFNHRIKILHKNYQVLIQKL